MKQQDNKKKADTYENLYRIDHKTGRIIIDISLGDYLEFFHEWDNATFRKRDIHADLAQFLDVCSEDIPIKKQLAIVFTLTNVERKSDTEDQIRISYLNYYKNHRRLENKKAKRFLRTSIISLGLSIILLFTYGVLIKQEPKSVLHRTILESLLIGGWVFAWEAVHLLFIDIIQPFHRRKEIKRFLDTEIRFRYHHN